MVAALTPRAAAATPAVGDAVDLRLVVARREHIADGVVRLTLADERGSRLPAWMPGAHIDLTGPTGLVRQFSLCGDLDDYWRWQIAVLRERDGGRGGSVAVHEGIKEGDRVAVRGPCNHFRLVDSPCYLFIAGGIGIAPILPMIQLVEREGRPWRLAYGGRTPATMAYLEELQAYGEKVRVFPSRVSGRMDLDAVLAAEAHGPVAIFCCGPPGLIDAVADRCSGVRSRRLRVERFQPIMDPTLVAQGAAFTIDLARSRRTLGVADGQTILEAMEADGLAPACSCREGVCGTCETHVLAGTPDHRDSVLDSSEQEDGGTMMICVSRSRTPRLVLDA